MLLLGHAPTSQSSGYLVDTTTEMNGESTEAQNSAEQNLGSLQKCCLDPLDCCSLDSARAKDMAPSIGVVGDCQVDGDGPQSNPTDSMRMARRYGATSICLALLERWLELGDRPSKELLDHMCTVVSSSKLDGNTNNTLMGLWENPVDDLKGLKQLVDDARRILWTKAFPPGQDSHLKIGISRIPKAQQGLFAAKDLPSNAICCYYSGDVHNSKSSQSSAMLKDASYLLRIGKVAREPWWYRAIAATSNASASSEEAAYVALRKIWDQLADSTAPTDFFVVPTNLNIKARYINDCLREDLFNVQFVLDPIGERAAIVTLRPIKAGEELYISYGKAYWNSLQATTGIVPQRLSL